MSPVLAALVAAVAIPAAIAMAFFYAPTAIIPLDRTHAQVDFAQKIFYLHVPIAFAAYWGFFAGAWNALLHLLKGDDDYDTRSYVGVHVGMVFGTLVLLTGSLWAKAAWGTWWQWGDRQLLVFLILYLFYAAYFMLRFSLDPGRYRATVSSAFTLMGAALVPLSFLAIRIANTLIHPVVITQNGFRMTGPMALTFLVSSIGFVALSTLMMQLETAGKIAAARQARAKARTRRPVPRTAPPAVAIVEATQLATSAATED